MSSACEFVSVLNPNPSYGLISLKKKSMDLFSLRYFKYDSILRTRGCKVSLVTNGISQNWLGAGFLTLDSRSSWNPSIVASSASRDDPHPEIEVEKEQDELKSGSEESEEAWKQALDSFKEQALKIQSQKKSVKKVKSISPQLQENSPEPVKEIVETFTSSTDDLNGISGVRDFHIGIPYGLILSVGGFLSFMVTGSIAAIRFGVILGGALLVLSVSSLRSYRRRESFPLALKGQAAIASIIFLRKIGLLSKRSSVLSYFNTLISGAVVAFYIYRILLDRKEKGSNLESGTEN
ncbi:protein FATTY ACID EXPORT 3, chloroplastic [Quillaja saponaria]|uniref:Protein FATTY ACID EXPORT 3, chloroplastic n=1 Tax=Quillaja saponaria TaxID=32244 RepID=A0AAD7PC66_QUISA|nr:protein FATTY ACID EXPORT 3, chloroplastic [Quillaja saponaria]